MIDTNCKTIFVEKYGINSIHM